MPGRAGFLLKQQRLICRDAQPGITLDFLLQLAGRPASIAKRQQAQARAAAARNRAQNIHTGRQREASAEPKATFRRPIIRMQHKAAASFHRPAGDQPDLALGWHRVKAELLQQFVKGQAFDRTIHHQPHRALGGVIAEAHHALRKARVLHARHRNQQMPGQIFASPAGGGFAFSGHDGNVAAPVRPCKSCLSGLDQGIIPAHREDQRSAIPGRSLRNPDFR